MAESLKIALIGNPNTGKTSLFNQLTGLQQQVGNYPGVTVERKVGNCTLTNGQKAKIIDLPGTYSLNTTSKDENVVLELLLNENDNDFPDVIVVVSEVVNLSRNLLLFTQIKDLGIPTCLVVNMIDQMPAKGIQLNVPLLEEFLGTKVILTNSRTGEGLHELKEKLSTSITENHKSLVDISKIDPLYFEALEKDFPNTSLYKLWLVVTHDLHWNQHTKTFVEAKVGVKNEIEIKKMQHRESVIRFQAIKQILAKTYQIQPEKAQNWQAKLDRIFTHAIFGYVFFFGLLFVMFQSIFHWSSIPMDFIDEQFANLSSWVSQTLPVGMLNSLITEGVIPGIGGVVIFMPQIAFLFLFISLLEESGYMSRVVVLMDRIMKPFGMNGKSIIPLISGTACAIPAVMATRNIENWRERLITILITPFTTCSARIPVYTILIALVIPNEYFLGVFQLQGMVMFLLYVAGFAVAILSAYVLHKLLKVEKKSYFVVELPSYKIPFYKNVGLNVYDKTKAFVFGAGKIIISISILLWFLASYGPNDQINLAEEWIVSQPEYQNVETEVVEDAIASYKLENSFIGYLGKAIEPVIQPLGYDWKIGIGIIASFAAREVFVGTMATIYSVGRSADEEATIKQRMQNERNPTTNQPIYNLASGISLLLFYAFAMQCMSTLAVVKKETNTWKWPMIQLFFMSGFAYLVAFISYQFFQ
jgi:ferrous iron transport protein B